MNITAFTISVAITTVSMFGFVPAALAEDDLAKGLRIAVAEDTRDKGFTDSVVDLEMRLSDQSGSTVSRDMTIYTLEVDGDGDKSITRFNSPRDVRGTALLTFSHVVEPDEQWLYLPSISRVKRISSKNKSGPFMGSEFAYEDLSSQEVGKYQYKYLRDEELDGVATYVLERVPVYKNSGYAKQISWLDQENYNIHKIEFYDRGERLLKTLFQSDHKLYQEKYWRPQTMRMVNHQTGKTTELVWGEYQFGNQLSSSLFTSNRLARIR